MLKLKRLERFFFSLLLFLCILQSESYASHLIAVEIRAKPLNCNSRTYEITVIGYVNTQSTVIFGDDDALLSFGDGKSIIVPGTSYILIDSILHVGRVEYKTLYTYEAPGRYILSYKEANRNEGILNMDASAFTTYFTETAITIGTGYCDSSPYLTVPPIDRACSGQAYYHNPGAIDPDDDSLSFSFALPQSQFETPVKNYGFPNDIKYYNAAGINYNSANETHDGAPSFIINPVDGTVSWNAPGARGEYAFAIKVVAWKFNRVDSTWFESGFSIRDMQVIVEDCSNERPDINLTEDRCVIAGTIIQFTAPASDPNGDPVIIEAFSDAFALSESPATVTPEKGIPQSTKAPNDTASIHFKWNTTCAHVKTQPYNIVFKITDTPPAGPRLVRFKTVSIKVMAPPPQFESVSVNPITKKVTLKWKDYFCDNNIQGIQIWRRIARYEYEQPDCNSGMPYFLRYNLLATLPGESKIYTDDDIDFGAQYCYRIVALIGENQIPSRISLDTCLIPKPAEAPVITEVSVIETSELNGSSRVRWTPPFDIDKLQYPPPYAYKIYRAQGFDDNAAFMELNDVPIQDTTYVDTPIDTQHNPYQYKVQLFVPTLTSSPVDTSSQASSVFLQTQSLPQKIKLSWEAQTPWFNYIQAYPYHLIYRSEQGPSGPFILIDSVDVNEQGFQFVDNGKFQGRKLTEEQVYYYKVLTRGAYGNPAIVEPLENFSEVSGATILDVRPPCTPIVSLEKTDCSKLSCNTDTYYNKLTWTFTDNACLEDGLTYRVFVVDNDIMIPLATVSGNSYEHTNLSSLAKCYSIAAIDEAGNISALSDPACNDNCPYFELPNVFTPGTEDGINDQFIAFGSETGTAKCARFVKKVDLKVYDRWGDEVYSIYDAAPDNNYIFWNGSSNNGKEVTPGIYFYSANVTFDMRDPAQRNKIIKGWVHLIR